MDRPPQQATNRDRAPFGEPRLAAALAGEREPLREALALLDGAPAPDEASGLLSGMRVPMLLARRAAENEPPLEPPRRLQALRARTAACWMLIERMLRALGEHLGDAGVPWIPIKGADVARTAYADPADRPMTDVDLLVPAASYRRARTALESAGWTSAVPGRRFDRFVEEEGTAWTAVRAGDPFPIELHFRLWGFVPEGLGDVLLERSETDAALGGTARRLRPVDRFLLAAVHPWLHLPPRSLANWWEVRMLLRVSGPEEAAESTRRWGLQLPVLLSASRAAELWEDDRCARLARILERTLRATERFTARRVLTGDPDRATIERLAVARLLARRPSRSGLRPLLRRVWAHPGIVECLTPEDWSWPRRRALHLLQCLGIVPAPRDDWWRAPTHGHRAR